MTRRPGQSLIGSFIREVVHHLVSFLLFLLVPAGAGVIVGLLTPANVLLCACIGAVVGFLAWCVRHWDTVILSLFD